MDCLTALITRRSALELTEPAPSGETLDAILAAAFNAPDHGLLQPWRFILVRGAARERLGALMARSRVASEPDLPQMVLEHERSKPMRAPLIIIVAALPKANPKVPEIEQIMSAATAAQNILVAAHALGYGGFWRTGAPAYDPIVKTGLGLRIGDAIVGFLYLGTIARPGPPKRKQVAPEIVVEEWKVQDKDMDQ